MTPLRFGRFIVDLTHESQVLFPDAGITKGTLIAYYRSIAPFIVPHTGDRPVAMECLPDGIDGQRVCYDVAPEGYPSWIRTVTVRREGATVRHAFVNDGATLVYLANQACITPHCWLSRRDALQRPDQLLFDLDPSPDGDFGAVGRAALQLRELCAELCLPAFVRTTGSRGLHVLSRWTAARPSPACATWLGTSQPCSPRAIRIVSRRMRTKASARAACG